MRRIAEGTPGRAMGGTRAGTFVLIALLLTLMPSRELAGQVKWQDLVFTGGLSAEGYRGSFPAVTVTAVDSTDHAVAVVGELSARGALSLFTRQDRTLTLHLDGGLRQFTAGGFEVRDYAPREWVGQFFLSYQHRHSAFGLWWVEGGSEARRVDDRPPIPLYIQPGYLSGQARSGVLLDPWRGIRFDAELSGEVADYKASGLTPQLDLLDRKSLGLEAGGTWGSSWTLRLHTGLRILAYENQGTFDPEDPYRRDLAASVGATWTVQSPLQAQVGVVGTFNRSNSNRPEYNALRVQALVGAPLPWGTALNLFAAVTAKDYLTSTAFARLVPGEEADNASQIYLEFSRPFLVNLDGALRFGWTRAETEFGASYFRRYGASFLVRFRPGDH